MYAYSPSKIGIMKHSRHFFASLSSRECACDFRFSSALVYERMELINTWPRRYTCLRHGVDVIAFEFEKFLNFLQDKNRSLFCLKNLLSKTATLKSHSLLLRGKVLYSAKSKIPTPYSSSRDTSASILAESSSAKLYGQARFPFNTDCNADCGRSLKLLHFVRLSPRPPRSNTTRIAHRIDHGNSTR